MHARTPPKRGKFSWMADYIVKVMAAFRVLGLGFRAVFRVWGLHANSVLHRDMWAIFLGPPPINSDHTEQCFLFEVHRLLPQTRQMVKGASCLSRRSLEVVISYMRDRHIDPIIL